MKKLTFGLTGGIASGKSTALKYFDQLGIPTCDTDQLARDVVSPGSEGQKELAEAIGADYFHNGIVNRAKLRKALFLQQPLKQKVESIIHPRVGYAVEKWRQNSGTAPYQILASPLLLETNQHDELDGVIVIDVNPDVQIRRACERDKLTVGEIEKIIHSQLSRKERLSYADFIFENSGSLAKLKHQIQNFHGQIIND